MNAKYECMHCGWKWEGKPGPTKCPKCGYFDNIKWHNYKKFMRPGQ